jgi:hypothetical protein
MFLGRKLRPGSFALSLAVRATMTAAGAIVAAMIFESAAMPKLQGELKAMNLRPPAGLAWVVPFQGHLRYVPIPALVLGIAAIALRPLRRPLAIAAMALALLAVVILVGSLVAAIAPMYQMPAELSAAM